jgi:hypothetical protein
MKMLRLAAILVLLLSTHAAAQFGQGSKKDKAPAVKSDIPCVLAAARAEAED